MNMPLRASRYLRTLVSSANAAGSSSAPNISIRIVLYVVACPRLPAIDAETRRAISGSRPTAGKLLENVVLRYSRAMSWASAETISIASGQPPRQAASTSPGVSPSHRQGSKRCSNKPARLTLPLDSPVSASVMGCMRMRPMRPAPLCAGASAFEPNAGVAEPVSI